VEVVPVAAGSDLAGDRATMARSETVLQKLAAERRGQALLRGPHSKRTPQHC
jgi:hypothetical protein